MNQDNSFAPAIGKPAIDDLQGLEIETFRVEELDQLDVDAADLTISLCSSTTSSTCCG